MRSCTPKLNMRRIRENGGMNAQLWIYFNDHSQIFIWFFSRLCARSNRFSNTQLYQIGHIKFHQSIRKPTTNHLFLEYKNLLHFEIIILQIHLKFSDNLSSFQLYQITSSVHLKQIFELKISHLHFNHFFIKILFSIFIGFSVWCWGWIYWYFMGSN